MSHWPLPAYTVPFSIGLNGAARARPPTLAFRIESALKDWMHSAFNQEHGSIDNMIVVMDRDC